MARHRFDPVSFVLGGVAVASGTVVLADRSITDDASVLLPGGLIALGVALFVKVVRSDRPAAAGTAATSAPVPVPPAVDRPDTDPVLTDGHATLDRFGTVPPSTDEHPTLDRPLPDPTSTDEHPTLDRPPPADTPPRDTVGSDPRHAGDAAPEPPGAADDTEAGDGDGSVTP